MKNKIWAMVVLCCMFFGTTVNAYNFPEPDWGALLKERENMVNAIDFELYTQGKIESAPYYGAPFEPRGGTYLGMVTENSQSFQPLGSYLTYLQNMQLTDIYYPANEIVRNSNSVVEVGWTIDDFSLINYDTIRQTLSNLNSYGKPMFIRFASEMNCSVLGDEPELYKEIFRNVANMVREYPNLAIVWSPIDLGSLDRSFEMYYPGDEYVDWVGISCYMIKYFQGNQNTAYNESVYFMTGDYAWATNRVKPFMEFMEKYGIKKPVMISEGGVPTNNKFGEELEYWATPRFRDTLYNLVMKYPQIKMINVFNTYRGNEAERFNISEFPYAVNIFNEAKANGPYITSYGTNANFVYQPAINGETLTAVNGIVPVYTLDHFPGDEYAAVNYYLDGQWYHSSTQIPYTCQIDISAMADGAHELSISCDGQTKAYTFYKRGNSIRFGAEPEGTGGISIKVDGNAIPFDQPPVIVDGRTMVPVRAIFEALGAGINWDDATKTVTAERWGVVIKMAIGNDVFYVDGRPVTLDVPAQIINGRTMVPVRAIGEALNCRVEWDGANSTVNIWSL